MHICKRFLAEKDGHFALVTALMAVPLVIGVGIAVDMSAMTRTTKAMQSSLDSAALAAVIPGNMTIAEREAFAEKVFFENYSGDARPEILTKATHNRVDIHGTVEYENLFLNIFDHKNSSEVSKSAAAVRTVEDVICVMTLDDSENRSLTFEKNAKFSAPGCSVQVNSSSRQALSSTGKYSPTAGSICVVGEAQGNVSKGIKEGCSEIDDPYAGKTFNDTSPCTYGPVNLMSFSSFQDLMIVGEPDAILNPGVYCGGLHIYDSNVRLRPGTYVMRDGSLTVGQYSKVEGDGVTFVFTGDQSTLYTYGDVKMDLTAPMTGDLAGLIFFQDPDSSVGETSIIKGGVDMKLVGTSYFPTQNLYIGGVGVMGAASPAMAFIAENITFTSDIETVLTAHEAYILEMKAMLEFVVMLAGDYGFTDYQVKSASAQLPSNSDFTTSIATSAASYDAAGVPPMVPRSDTGARLVYTGSDQPLPDTQR